MDLGNFLFPLTWAGVGLAILCGGIVGFERQIRGKPAGMRTSILICLGTQVFVELGTAFSGPGTDPTRVLGQVVTGIGFLGAGVILARGGVVTGVTTASVVWLLAAIGCTIGFGHYGAAVVLAALTVAILNGIELLEASFRRLRSGPRDGDPRSRPNGP
ncbi:MAG: MgtC/SapB family protein [Candidatus Eisenbacteria bacterium]|nr:MgtC/SapB family protein [Candidatus Eisenbacteria bacterium]